MHKLFKLFYFVLLSVHVHAFCMERYFLSVYPTKNSHPELGNPLLLDPVETSHVYCPVYNKKNGKQYHWAVWLSDKAKQGKTEEELHAIARESVKLHVAIRWKKDSLPAQISPLVDVNAFFSSWGDPVINTTLSVVWFLSDDENTNYKRISAVVDLLCTADIDVNLPMHGVSQNSPIYNFLLPVTTFDKTPVIKKLFNKGCSMRMLLERANSGWSYVIKDASPREIKSSLRAYKPIEKFAFAAKIWRECEQEKRKRDALKLVPALLPSISISDVCLLIAEYYPCFADQEYEAIENMEDMAANPTKYFPLLEDDEKKDEEKDQEV